MSKSRECLMAIPEVRVEMEEPHSPEPRRPQQAVNAPESWNKIFKRPEPVELTKESLAAIQEQEEESKKPKPAAQIPATTMRLESLIQVTSRETEHPLSKL